ncbi:MAG TPA: biotin carboxylase N-terminal domain-containing protein, partial [Solirubrobacteraceae bacterium]
MDLQRPFSRLAIVNRGEPAMRVIHAVRELNVHRSEPIRVIALYTEPERDAMFVRDADEAVALDGGYLDHEALERALREARADAVWVGWGFVAEQAELAELCERLGIVFVGPDAATMRLVGDRIAAKRLAEAAGVPTAPWSGGPVATADEALRHAERIGFPVMVKATAGRGGRGVRRVDEPGALAAAFAGAQSEAEQAFGDATVLLERLVAPARHVEAQVIADGRGGAWAVGLRDCSCRQGDQRLIEESSSPALGCEREREVLNAARRLALHAGYRGAGTVGFLYEPATQAFSFLKVDAWLQAEHPVTEAVTGLDLVKLQLHVAAGGRVEGEPPAPTGHAVEARLNAEDPALGFRPAPGRIALLRLPTGPGVRVDTGVAEGDVIRAELDSTLAKVTTWGNDRDEALARLRRALAETMVVVDGGTTNQGFLLALLDRPEVRSGDVDTAWLDGLRLTGEIGRARHADVALLQAAIAVADRATADERARFYAFARRGRPQAGADLTRTVELRHGGQSYRLAVSQVAPDRHRVVVDGETVEVTSHGLGRHERRVEVHGLSHRTLTSVQDVDLLVEVDGVAHRIARDDGGLVRSLAPAVVVSIPVAVGDEVDAGGVVAVVEAMKMETSLTAPFHGRVRAVLAGTNVHVGAHAPLVALEPLDGGPPPAPGERVS